MLVSMQEGPWHTMCIRICTPSGIECTCSYAVIFKGLIKSMEIFADHSAAMICMVEYICTLFP